MNDSSFDALVDQTLMELERQIEASGSDVDFEMSAGILTLTLPSGSKIIINRQLATQEIWVAAKSGGYHCAYQDNVWRCHTTQESLPELVSRVIAEQGGGSVALS